MGAVELRVSEEETKGATASGVQIHPDIAQRLGFETDDDILLQRMNERLEVAEETTAHVDVSDTQNSQHIALNAPAKSELGAAPMERVFVRDPAFC